VGTEGVSRVNFFRASAKTIAVAAMAKAGPGYFSRTVMGVVGKSERGEGCFRDWGSITKNGCRLPVNGSMAHHMEARNYE
jgi:hypothetical protein